MYFTVQDAIEQRHRPIAQFLRSGEGIRLQRKDSDLANAVMLVMMERGILAIPIHDSFVVDHRDTETLREEMTRACCDRLAIKIPIKGDPFMVDHLGAVSSQAVD